MRRARITGEAEATNYYHVVSRTAGGAMLFGAHEKNVFAKQLRKQAAFAGIKVLTWCMMDNHFHILVKLPPRDEFVRDLLANGRERFWKQLRYLYSREEVKAVRCEVELLERKGKSGRAAELIERYTRRMAELSRFVQGLKHAFSVWFNRKHERRGTLWMERYKSVLLEGEKRVLNKVAAYIDLNPVRAGLVEDPGDYRWSGYGQAVGGVAEARRGLSAVYGYRRNEWSQIAGDYRQLLFVEGMLVCDESGEIARAGIGSEAVEKQLAARGREALTKRLARRVRYFSDGAAIGSREFLEGVFERHRDRFGPKRKSGARKMRGASWPGVFAMRDLRSE